MPKAVNPHLTVVTEHWVPWVSIRDDPDRPGEKIFEGVMMEVLAHLSARLGFTYRLIQPYDHQWGKPSPNGSWNGMIGMLQRK